MSTTATTEYPAHREVRSLSTPDLAIGDIVDNYGLRLEIIAGPRTYGPQDETYVWTGLVLNADEVDAEQAAFTARGGSTLTSAAFLLRFARSDARRRGDDQLTYSIQGNHLATWSVETGEWFAVCNDCHVKVPDHTEAGALAARALHRRYSCPGPRA